MPHESLTERTKSSLTSPKKELQDATGYIVKKEGTRGLPPKLIWKSIIPEKKAATESAGKVTTCRSRESQLRDTMSISETANDGATEELKERARELMGCLRNEGDAAPQHETRPRPPPNREEGLLFLVEELMKLLEEDAERGHDHEVRGQEW